MLHCAFRRLKLFWLLKRERHTSPFVGRLYEIGQNGMALTADIIQIYGNCNSDRYRSGNFLSDWKKNRKLELKI